jgi:septal ring factor EnvC (AmiA/AmiB activator)
LLLPLLSSRFSLVYAADPREELLEVQKKLTKQKSKVKQTITKEKSILSELDQIDKTIKKKKEELRYFDARLSETHSKIRQLENEILLLDGKLKIRKKYLNERLNSLYKQRRGEIVSILISARDYQDFIKRSRYISSIAYYDSKQMKMYSEEINDLNIKMKHMEILKNELETNKMNVKKKADELQAESTKKKELFTLIKSKRHSYEEMVVELEESSKNLQELIKQLEDDKAPLSVAGKGFDVLRGNLPWPVAGKVLASFGKYDDPKFNIPTFRKGVEIGANNGDTVLAVSEGRVVYADWFKGYGLLLIINHGNGYHTLYAHLSEIFNKTGDIINRRQAVGKIGESGTFDVPSLYFEIRHKGKPLNPIEWLVRKK